LVLFQLVLQTYAQVPEKQLEYGEDGKALDGSGRREPPPLAADAKASVLWLVGEHCTASADATARYSRKSVVSSGSHGRR
jgi:hypothetical protein